jgi:hypothetical protein
MKYSVLIIFLLVCMAAFASAQTDNYVTLLENTDQCFDCHTTYQICNPSEKSLSLDSKDMFDLKFYDKKGESYNGIDENGDLISSTKGINLDLENVQLKYKVTEDYTVDVADYVDCQVTTPYSTMDNDTGEIIDSGSTVADTTCFNGYHTESRQRDVWQDFNPKAKPELASGECIIIEVSGNIRNNQMVDNVLTYNGHEYKEYAAWYANWAYKRPFNITNNYSDDLIGYPTSISVDTTGAWFGNCSSIRIIYNDTTPISWINKTGCGLPNTQIWFRVNISANTVTTSYSLYYGNPSAPDGRSNLSFVLGYNYDNNLLMRWHLDEGNGNKSISTGSLANDMTHQQATIVNQSGNWALDKSKCLYENCVANGNVQASNSWLHGQITNFMTNSTTPFTIECWVYGISPVKDSYFVSRANLGALVSGDFKLGLLNNGSSLAGAALGSGWVTNMFSNPPSYINNWSHYAYTRGVDKTDAMYINGFSNVSSNDNSSLSDISNTHIWSLGAILNDATTPVSTLYFNGYLQECAISNVSRTAAELRQHAQYYNLNYTLSNDLVGMGPANETDARAAIVQGITNALGSGATIYTDIQVYIRYLNGTQKIGRFDKLASFGNQRWAFNYITSNESSTGMSSLGKVINIVEYTNVTSYEIALNVQNAISATLTQ